MVLEFGFLSYLFVDVRCFTSRASVSLYSKAVRTDCDVILGLFRALIAACESESIFIYLKSSSSAFARAYWHAWLMASISAWKTVDVSGMCIDSACILLFL